MSNELIFKATEIEIPGGGSIKTDNPVVEAAIAAGIVGIAAYAVCKRLKQEKTPSPGNLSAADKDDLP
jgi:hypothetical protein